MSYPALYDNESGPMEAEIHEILRKVHVNVPFQDLARNYMGRFLQRGINPEIGFNSSVPDEFSDADFRSAAARIREAGLRSTVHAPFMDLRPGAVDPLIREVSERRIIQAVEIAAKFSPENIIGHPCFDRRYYVSNENSWLEASAKTWRAVLAAIGPAGPVLCLENVYENGPKQIKSLLAALGSPGAGFCFDTGHFNAFAEAPLEEWLDELGGFIVELHLHDNFGGADQHLPVGEGNFPFHDLFTMLKQIKKKPLITLEPHNEAHLWKTLENIARLDLLKDFD